jgi:hypothetical protein
VALISLIGSLVNIAVLSGFAFGLVVLRFVILALGNLLENL